MALTWLHQLLSLHVPLHHPTKANAKADANAKGVMASGRQLASIRGLDTAEDSTKAFLPTPMARNGSQKSTSRQHAGDGFLTVQFPGPFSTLVTISAHMS